mmetsp:Transcript_20988/g.59937  ORF Transcript_20988/g.59937 Transcript_20988/m.59937 type:complete len:222 (-) Transcript_20988:249-914(-)
MLLPERALLRQKERFEAHRHEHGVRVQLHDPVARPSILVRDDLLPESEEDLGVQDRVELATQNAGHGPVDDAGRDIRGLALGGQDDRPVAVDFELVATEKPHLTMRILGPQQLGLVSVGHHHRGAEQRRVLYMEGTHRVGEGRAGVLGPRLVHAAVEVLAAALVGHAVVRKIARPLVDGVAPLESEDEVAGARRAGRVATGLVSVQGKLELLELLQARMRG